MMDDHLHNQSRLEQATMRSLPPGTRLDEEATELREGWQAMGRAADADNAGFCEGDLLARLLPMVALEAARQKPERPSRTERLWPALLASALALTLLVAVLRMAGRDEDVGTIANTPSYLQSETQIAVATTAWSDPLDDEILGTAERLRELVAQGTGVDDSLSNLSDHLESMSDDLTESSL